MNQEMSMMTYGSLFKNQLFLLISSSTRLSETWPSFDSDRLQKEADNGLCKHGVIVHSNPLNKALDAGMLNNGCSSPLGDIEGPMVHTHQKVASFVATLMCTPSCGAAPRALKPHSTVKSKTTVFSFFTFHIQPNCGTEWFPTAAWLSIFLYAYKEEGRRQLPFGNCLVLRV